MNPPNKSDDGSREYVVRPRRPRRAYYPQRIPWPGQGLRSDGSSEATHRERPKANPTAKGGDRQREGSGEGPVAGGFVV